jgi:anti-anti-sigma factor
MHDGEAPCEVTRLDDPSSDGRLHLAVCGELDISSTNGVRIRLGRLIGVRRDVVIDLSGLTFIGASGLAMFTTLHAAMRARGGSLRLCGLRPRHRQLFEWTQLQYLLDPVG